MNKQIHSGIVALLLLSATVASSHAALQAIVPTGPESWNGSWSAGDGSVITIASRGGFLDILGKDSGSTFTATCILAEVPKRNRADCVGHGVNHSSTLRFLYKSSMALNAEGDIVEEWQADFWDAKTAKRFPKTGTVTFKRMSANTR